MSVYEVTCTVQQIWGFFWIYELQCVAKVATVWASKKIYQIYIKTNIYLLIIIYIYIYIYVCVCVCVCVCVHQGCISECVHGCQGCISFHRHLYVCMCIKAVLICVYVSVG